MFGDFDDINRESFEGKDLFLLYQSIRHSVIGNRYDNDFGFDLTLIFTPECCLWPSIGHNSDNSVQYLSLYTDSGVGLSVWQHMRYRT